MGLPVPPADFCTLCGATQLIESYALNITTPNKNTAIYIDPEIPPKYSTISLNCAVKPQSSALLREVNGEEHKIAECDELNG